MAISKEKDSKPGHVSSKDKSKLRQKKTWDTKRRLVKERLENLNHAIKNEESENMDLPIICYRAKVDKTRSLPNCNSVSTSAMERAQELQKKLALEFPSFWKLMSKSHVSGGFWLSLPKSFCDLHLPKHDETIELVDDIEQEYEAIYLAGKNGLSGGWRGFSLAHGLMEGDVVVFQLTEPRTFKIYIVRASGLSEMDGAIGLLNLDKPTDAVKTKDQSGEGGRISETKKLRNQDPVASDIQKGKSMKVLVPENEPPADQCDDDSYGSDSRVVEGIRLSESVVSFKDVKDFKDFTISVNGLILDTELEMHLRRKYYELCCSQGKFLHESLTNGLNAKLATGIISETVNIADAIRCSITTSSLNDMDTWDKTLKAFEDLGMAVGFLRDPLGVITGYYRQFQEIVEPKRKAKAGAEDDIKCLKEKLLEVEAVVKRLDEQIDSWEVKKQELDVIVRDIAGRIP